MLGIGLDSVRSRDFMYVAFAGSRPPLYGTFQAGMKLPPTPRKGHVQNEQSEYCRHNWLLQLEHQLGCYSLASKQAKRRRLFTKRFHRFSGGPLRGPVARSFWRRRRYRWPRRSLWRWTGARREHANVKRHRAPL